MNDDALRRAFEIFDEVCDLPEGERSLDVRCGGDPEVRAEVERMLRSDAASDDDFPAGEGAEALAAGLAEATPSEMPSSIGRYRVIREIGRGGMGVVYEAEQEEPRRRVAVKVIRDGIASEEVVRRFRTESQLLGRLQHPGVANIYEAGVDTVDGSRRSYYAMEFIDGLPIDRHAAEHGLDIRQRVELIARVCDAVQHAHQKGILHRDLKPANVLVSPARDETGAGSTDSTRIDSIGQPKVVDFGIARLTDDDNGLTEHTRAGQVLGSIASMSPEQLSGSRDGVDTRSDVYAIGVMLYRLLAGRAPHDLTGLSIADAARAVTEHEPPTIGAVEPSLRGDLSVITAKALERETERRYSSVALMADDLRRFLRDEPIAARPTARWYRFRKYAKRHRVAVGSACAAVVLLVAATIVSTTFGLRAGSSQREAERTAVLADRAAYRASISAASAAVRDGDARLAREFLAEAPEALRGWEWRRLERELDQSTAEGRRELTWTGDQADFLHGACWISPDGRVLFAPTSIGDRRAFESFDAVTLRALGRWEAASGEQSVGVFEQEQQFVMYDSESQELVFRDLITGNESERRSLDDGGAAAPESYEPLSDIPTRIARIDHRGRGVWMGSRSPDGSRWVPWRGNRGHIDVLHGDGDRIELGRVGEGLSHARFSPDGRLLAFTTLDRSINLIDVDTGEWYWSNPEAHTDAPMSLAFSPDGRMLVTGGQDRVIRLWDAETGQSLGPLIGHEETVIGLCFSPSGEVLYSADGLGVRSWRVREALDRGVLIQHKSFIGGMALSDDGSAIASHVVPQNVFFAPTREVIVASTRSGERERLLSLPLGEGGVSAAGFLDGLRVAVVAGGPRSSGDEVLSPLAAVFDASTGALLQSRAVDELLDTTEMGGAERDPSLIQFLQGRRGDPSEPTFRRGPVPAWVGADGSVIHEFPSTQSGIRVSLVDRAAGRVYAGTVEGVLHVFDINTGEVIETLETSGESLWSLALLPDGSRLFGGSGDTTIRVWDTETLELVAVLRGHRDSVKHLLVSPDGATLFSGSDDYTVRQWTTRSQHRGEGGAN